MAREYGWTLPVIDALEAIERTRIARIWATESLTRDAEQYLAKHAHGQAAAQRTVAERQARRELQDE